MTANFSRVITKVRTVRRSIRWVESPGPDTDGYGAVEIVQDRKADLYLVRQIPADFGRGYQLEKLAADLSTAEVYDINLASSESACTCPGHSFHGHCKHVAGLLALEQRGELPHCWRKEAV